MVGKGLRLIQQWDRWDNPPQPLTRGLPFPGPPPICSLITQPRLLGTPHSCWPWIPSGCHRGNQSQHQLQGLICNWLVIGAYSQVNIFLVPPITKSCLKFSLCFAYSSYFALSTGILICNSLYLAIQHCRNTKTNACKFREIWWTNNAQWAERNQNSPQSKNQTRKKICVTDVKNLPRCWCQYLPPLRQWQV